MKNVDDGDRYSTQRPTELYAGVTVVKEGEHHSIDAMRPETTVF